MHQPCSVSALVPLPTGGALDEQAAAHRLLQAFLAGRSPATIKSYGQDMKSFAVFTGDTSPEGAAGRLLSLGPGPANHLALGYRNHLLERGLTPATVNRRLASLRSLVKLARTLGLVNWSLEVEGVKAESYRDTHGPGAEGFKRMLHRLSGRTDKKGVRDRALLQLLYHLGLRRGEVCRLDVGDLDLVRSTVAVLGKGRSQKETLTLPGLTKAALAEWLQVRGDDPGPLFSSLDRARKGSGRITGSALYALVRQLGKAVGLTTRPHGLRHAAITAALDLTGGDVRAVQRFSRHRDLNILQTYDDNRQDLGGAVARKLAAG